MHSGIPLPVGRAPPVAGLLGPPGRHHRQLRPRRIRGDEHLRRGITGIDYRYRYDASKHYKK